MVRPVRSWPSTSRNCTLPCSRAVARLVVERYELPDVDVREAISIGAEEEIFFDVSLDLPHPRAGHRGERRDKPSRP